LEAQETKIHKLETFSKLNLEGNIEIHLVEGLTATVKIKTNRTKDFQDLEIEVINNELFIAYKKDENKTPKFIVYLEHTGIDKISMSGLISLFSEDMIKGAHLTLKGSGIIKGVVEVEVKHLRIDADGITNLSILGTTDSAIFNIDGLGKINAKKLEARSVQQHSDGFAKVKVGS